MDHEKKYAESIRYIREKIDQLLEVMGTLPLRPEELDDHTLIELDPIGIIAQSFKQVLKHQNDTNAALKIAQEEIRSIFDSINAAVIVIDSNRRIEDFNLLAHDLFFNNRPQDKIYGALADDVCNCDKGFLDQLLNDSEQVKDFENEGRHFLVNATIIGDPSNDEHKAIILYTDITRQKQAEVNLKLYENVFNSTAEGIVITDKNVRIVEVNKAFCKMSGYTLEELIGKTPSVLKSYLHNDYFYDELWKELSKTGLWKGELIDRRKDGSLIPLLQSISRLDDSDGTPQHYISVLTDITSLKETESRLEFLAHHDVLTKLPNRLLFQDRLKQAIERASRNQQHFGLLFIDLDHFKNINDSLGHDIGDKLLQAVSARISSLVRKSDTLSRLGGDEFVVLLENLTKPTFCDQFAQKIVEILKPVFTIEHHQLHVDCSIGISIYPDDGDNATNLLKNADTAMYRAKESGRDGFVKYSRDLTDTTIEKLTIEGALRNALTKGEFFLNYQPIVDTLNTRVFAAESLIRWESDELGYITPDRFIPIAESSKLIIAIGYWVFERSVEQIKQWHNNDINIDYISINVSSIQLYHDGFVSTLAEIIGKYDVAPEAIQIEITENIMMRDIEHCIKILEELRSIGFKLAIDDFGTGYSSLSYLRTLPVDLLKIDRSFIHQIPDNVNDSMITNAIITLAQTLKMSVIAEGIEYKTQMRFLEECGCHHFQGFLFSKPINESEFEQFFHSYTKKSSVINSSND